MRIAYQYHHLSEEAKKVAMKENEGMLLTQFLYNSDGTRFQTSTEKYAKVDVQQIVAEM